MEWQPWHHWRCSVGGSHGDWRNPVQWIKTKQHALFNFLSQPLSIQHLNCTHYLVSHIIDVRHIQIVLTLICAYHAIFPVIIKCAIFNIFAHMKFGGGRIEQIIVATLWEWINTSQCNKLASVCKTSRVILGDRYGLLGWGTHVSPSQTHCFEVALHIIIQMWGHGSRTISVCFELEVLISKYKCRWCTATQILM